MPAGAHPPGPPCKHLLIWTKSSNAEEERRASRGVHPRLQSPLAHSSPGFMDRALQFWQGGRGTVSLPPALHCQFRHHEHCGPPKPGAQTERERHGARGGVARWACVVGGGAVGAQVTHAVSRAKSVQRCRG